MAARPATPAPSASPRRTLVTLTICSMVLAALAGALTLWMSRELRSVEGEREQVRKLAEKCKDPTHSGFTVPESSAPPPQDRVRLDRPYLGNEGVDISALMRVRVSRVDERRRLGEVMVGAPAVLPSQTIHVVNLWAVWCEACKDEMPDLQRLFQRRAAEWKESVDFVAIQVEDHGDPIDAYDQWGPKMPTGAIKLADRGMNAPFISILKGDAQRQPLYYGRLPVTFVLDCNRRVRWAKFDRLSEADVHDLETWIDNFRDELADTGPDARCGRVWCGNGRCEAGESYSCIEDCGERSMPAATGVGNTSGESTEPPPMTTSHEPPPITPPDPPTCPSYCAYCTPGGRCVAKVQGTSPATSSDPTPPPAKARCGDGVCEVAAGESAATCCRDCGCNAPFECGETDAGEYVCRPRLKH
ncbi:MAG: TlpA disulfide reductase family protein [Nannocystaceae bacterium]